MGIEALAIISIAFVWMVAAICAIGMRIISTMS